ncbi:pgpA [Wigglesworthia glossinidia endosymbiont of Glossina brevipalpis]|uniref:Phosphatidylglycerophosphatase A n=1 Tax=Wigglesworthia glossinidia brevipalpis TaxID=36870 RepID=Q8D288_WIGBR|nr:pgpA [Wigglesworthia glossinidia endosymbiont of Glossina brevipalpis]
MKKNRKSKFFINLFNPINIISTFFGIGLIPYVSGTLGSIISIIIWYYSNNIFIKYEWIFITLGVMLGIYCCEKTSLYIKHHDHYCIIFDEIVGMWIVLLNCSINDYKSIILGLFFFRIFDIIKPWPINWINKNILNGFGIILDDLLAGIYSLIMLFIYNAILLFNM